MKIYIDVGHGGSDPGAVSGKFIEHNMAAVTANAMAERLRYHGAQVKLEEGNLTLARSAAEANSFGADLLISQHYNAGGGNRGEAIYSIRNGSSRLADAVLEGFKNAGQTSVRKYSKINSAGSADYYGILRGCNMPAVIAEPCFIDNAQDVTLADTPEKQAALGAAVADAIAREYGFYKEEEGGKPEVAEIRYNSLETVPDWGKDTISKLITKGILKGGDTGLDLSYDMLRMLVINDRAGLYE